ncbi:MAG: PEP-CTERM sorting domain-containing protein, partial [Akkermansia sp.]|nr:PEP-CTERM sorting domain-containing protein [Akkermansia sp.]
NTLIKGDTNITLSGGTVTGNVYAGGQDDIINGNTNVTVLGAGTQVDGTVSGGGDNSTIAGDRNLKIGTNDIAATCSFSIKDFDNLIIAAGSEATLEFADTASQMTLDNLALLVDSDNESATLTLNNISFDSFTLMIELTDEQISSAGTPLSFTNLSLAGVDLTGIETDVVFVDSQGKKVSTISENVTYDNNTGTFSVTASIPEPTTATLSLLALAGLAARRRRK